MKPEWKPCPFCGGTDIRHTAHPNQRFGDWEHHPAEMPYIYSMCCYDCGATFPNRYKLEHLNAAWNRRT